MTKVEVTDTDTLMCPRCGNDNLHHETITVFGRELEDTPTRAIIVGAGAGEAHILEAGQAERDNPSSRRGAVTVRFYCEQCWWLSELMLEQHKGSTYVRWRPAGQRVDLPG